MNGKTNPKVKNAGRDAGGTKGNGEGKFKNPTRILGRLRTYCFIGEQGRVSTIRSTVPLL
jgi:hypothetical protein